MTALRDPDDLPPITEDRAAEWIADSRREEPTVEDTAQEVLQQVRRYLVAVETARRIGADPQPVVDELNAYVSAVHASDNGPSVLAKALYDAVWVGGRTVPDLARKQLLRLRDMHDITPVLEQGVQL